MKRGISPRRRKGANRTRIRRERVPALPEDREISKKQTRIFEENEEERKERRETRKWEWKRGDDDSDDDGEQKVSSLPAASATRRSPVRVRSAYRRDSRAFRNANDASEEITKKEQVKPGESFFRFSAGSVYETSEAKAPEEALEKYRLL